MRHRAHRDPITRLTRRGGLAALFLAPLAVALVLFSEPSPSPADSTLFNEPAVVPEPALAVAPAGAPPVVAAPAPAAAMAPLLTLAVAAPRSDLEQAIPASHYAVAQQTTGIVLQGEAAPAAISLVVEVAAGDTLMKLLSREGIDRGEAHEAAAALAEVFSPRDLRPGQQIRLTFAATEETLAAAGEESPGPQLVALALQPDVDKDVQVVRTDEGSFAASAAERTLRLELAAQSGIIEDSLFASAEAAGVPVSTLIELIRIFSYDVDFQREIQPGDGFAVLYESYYDDAGQLAKTGQILYAGLVLSGKPHDLYFFTPESGIEDFFDPKGQSVRKALMKTPIDGARLSSKFGMRKHPILGYSKMHKGADFAAPSGTPIYAAGDGVVETAGWNGGYGKYVRLKHNGTYKTAYAHMSKIAKGLAKGDRVKQGEIIGFVGTTGQSTGPHLHYEVMIDGKQVNPLDIKIPSGEKLAGKDLEQFLLVVAEVEALRQQLAAPLVAEAP